MEIARLRAASGNFCHIRAEPLPSQHSAGYKHLVTPYESTQPLLDAIEQLQSQHEHISNSTRVLEAIIAHCSDIARQAPRSSMRAVAIRLRSTAISLYATPKTNSSATIRDFLEVAIATLEQEVKSEVELLRTHPAVERKHSKT